MVIGLSSTRLLSFLVYDKGAGGRYLMLAAGLAAALGFGWLAWLVSQEHLWALRVGIVLYAADTLVKAYSTGTKDLLGLGFHVLTLGLITFGYLTIPGLQNAAVPARSETT